MLLTLDRNVNKMTMEEKKRKGLQLPRKPPNKVGVETRSQSAGSGLEKQSTIKERPLSLDVNRLTQVREVLQPTTKTRLIFPLQFPNGFSSASENNIAELNEDDDSLNSPRSSSADSLAKKSQVFNLIPTSRARQRNFLQGRVGPYSLLGQHELERVCPNREVTIFVGTWNMNGHSPPK